MSQLPGIPCKPSGAMSYPWYGLPTTTATTTTTSGTDLASLLKKDTHDYEQESQRCELGLSTSKPCESENEIIGSGSIKERLSKAINHYQSMNRDRNSLIQIWVPVKKGIGNFLTTADQPCSYDPTCSSLLNFRHVSQNYQFSADHVDSKLGLPARVFLGKAPEWTPNVQFFKQDEYQRANHAHLCDIRGSIALPVFDKLQENCLGVVEIVTTAQKITYRSEADTICQALEAVDLTSCQLLSPSKEREPHSAELSEISHIVRTICEKHELPLGQTWAPCIQQSRYRNWPSDKSTCASIVDSTCCVCDQRISGFREACLEQQLLRGQGVVGKAFMTNQPCYAIDVAAYSKAEYPLSHHAQMFGLRGAVAIHLQHLYGACESYVLEFFLPIDCQELGLAFHFKIMESLTMMVQGARSFCFLSGKETRQETAFHGKELLFFSSEGKLGGEDEARVQSSLSNKPSHKDTSWISSLVEVQRKGKEVSLSFEFGKGLGEELKMTTQWSETNKLPECGNLAGSSLGSDWSLGTPKAGEKKRTKSQKTISLQVLEQYFAGSLKDAAKSMGVCPTTLKRICRQYGIKRWPSRKIKKVDHSLRKLQHVIDSVQGAKGSIQLSSFYSDFPQLSPTAAKINDPWRQLNASPENLMFSSEETTSQSTSSSQTSSSSHTFSTGEPTTLNACGSGDTSMSQDPVRTSKRARFEAELPVLNHRSPTILGRTQSNISVSEHPQVEFLARNNRNLAQKDGAVCKVKATFGEEMIRLTLTPNTGFGDLQCEIARRFSIGDFSKMHIKYLDDEKEWVLLTCDGDLEECIDIQRSSGSSTVKFSVHLSS